MKENAKTNLMARTKTMDAANLTVICSRISWKRITTRKTTKLEILVVQIKKHRMTPHFCKNNRLK